jgi:hypothetical protein
MGGRPKALIVSEDSAKIDRWALWLEDEGFAVSTCPGPHVSANCPRLDGSPCSIREAVDFAVIDVHPLGASELYGGWAERSCTKIPDDGRSVFVHTPRIETSFRENGVHVGYRVSKDSLLAAIRRVQRLFTVRPAD